MDYQEEYQTALNKHTATKIVTALETYTDISKAHSTTNLLPDIQIIFLFSGRNPVCEYEICNILQQKYTITCVYLVDFYHPEITNERIKYVKEIITTNFSEINKTFSENKTVFENKKLLDIKKPFTYCIGIHPQHNIKTKTHSILMIRELE